MTFDDVLKAQEVTRRKTWRRWLGWGGLVMVIFEACLVPSIVSIAGDTGWAPEERLSFAVSFILGTSVICLVALTIVFLVMLKFFGTGPKSEYARAYKAYFVEKSLAEVFTDLSYAHDRGLEREVIWATGMIAAGNEYSSNDLVVGKYKDVAFSQADVYIGNSDDDGHTKYFKGRWMIFEFPKSFSFRLKIRERGFLTHTALRPGGHKLKRIEVESPEFNKMFKIYAEDGFEAFYLLDPALLDGIVQLGRNYAGKIMLGFADNRLHVALYDNKNAFEPPMALKTLDEQAELAKVKGEISVVTDFIDKLRLNQKIFG